MVRATSPAALRSLLGCYNLAPRKGLGQHFLWQQRVAERMAEAAELDPGDLVLEIGPGLGILTAACAERAGLVIAVEIDADLFPLLESELQAYPNVCLVQGDARKTDWTGLVRQMALAHPGWVSRVPDSHPLSGYPERVPRPGARPANAGTPARHPAGTPARCKVMGNLPYYLSSPLLVGLLSGGLHPELMVLMVQQEVAERIVAGPGSKIYGSLSVLARYYSVPELLFSVAPQEFWPQPKVTSAVIRLRLRPEPAVKVRDEALFFQVVRAAFRFRRKTLKNALSEAGLLPSSAARRRAAPHPTPPHPSTGWVPDRMGTRPDGQLAPADVDTPLAEALFQAAGIDPGRRGETLDLAEFACLAEALAQARERTVADALH